MTNIKASEHLIENGATGPAQRSGTGWLFERANAAQVGASNKQVAVQQANPLLASMLEQPVPPNPVHPTYVTGYVPPTNRTIGPSPALPPIVAMLGDTGGQAQLNESMMVQRMHSNANSSSTNITGNLANSSVNSAQACRSNFVGAIGNPQAGSNVQMHEQLAQQVLGYENMSQGTNGARNNYYYSNMMQSTIGFNQQMRCENMQQPARINFGNSVHDTSAQTGNRMFQIDGNTGANERMHTPVTIPNWNYSNAYIPWGCAGGNCGCGWSGSVANSMAHLQLGECGYRGNGEGIMGQASGGGQEMGNGQVLCPVSFNNQHFGLMKDEIAGDMLIEIPDPNQMHTPQH